MTIVTVSGSVTSLAVDVAVDVVAGAVFMESELLPQQRLRASTSACTAASSASVSVDVYAVAITRRCGLRHCCCRGGGKRCSRGLHRHCGRCSDRVRGRDRGRSGYRHSCFDCDCGSSGGRRDRLRCRRVVVAVTGSVASCGRRSVDRRSSLAVGIMTAIATGKRQFRYTGKQFM